MHGTNSRAVWFFTMAALDGHCSGFCICEIEPGKSLQANLTMDFDTAGDAGETSDAAFWVSDHEAVHWNCSPLSSDFSPAQKFLAT